MSYNPYQKKEKKINIIPQVVFILTLILMVLKFAEAIEWSWWIVFCPILIWVGAVIGFYIILFITAMMALYFRKRRENEEM